MHIALWSTILFRDWWIKTTDRKAMLSQYYSEIDAICGFNIHDLPCLENKLKPHWPGNHPIWGARYACIASFMFHLNSLKSFLDSSEKKVLSRRRRIHHLYFFFRQEGSPSYKCANHSTTACLILPLLNEQLKSSKILLLEVINPKKKRSWMLFFHTQLMPPVLGYYRRPAVRPALTKPTAGRPPGSPLRAPTQNPDLTHSRDVDKVQGADVTCALLIPKAAYTGILRKLRYKMWSGP